MKASHNGATVLCAFALVSAAVASPIASHVLVTKATITTEELVKRDQFPGDGAFGAQYASSYRYSASLFAQPDRIETFFMNGSESTWIAFPNDATAYCFAVPGATATALSGWVADALAINSVPQSQFVSDVGEYVSESLSLFDSACGVKASSSQSSAFPSAAKTTSSPSQQAIPTVGNSASPSPSPSSTVTSTSAPMSSVKASATSTKAASSSTAQDPTDSFISVLQSIIPQTALDDPTAQCFLFSSGASTPVWYSALPSDARTFLQSIEATDTAGCAVPSTTIPGVYTPNTAPNTTPNTTPKVASTFLTTSGGTTVLVTATPQGTESTEATRTGGVGFFGQSSIPTESSGTSPSQQASSTAPAAASGGGLSTGAKAGIGGGVAGGVLVIGIVAAIVGKTISASSGSAAAGGKAALGNSGGQDPAPANTGNAPYNPANPTNPQGPYSGNPGNAPVQPPQGVPNTSYPPPMHHDAQAPMLLGAAVAARRNTQSPEHSQYSEQSRSLSPSAYGPSSPVSELMPGGSGHYSSDGSSQYLVNQQYDPRHSGGGMSAQHSGGSNQLMYPGPDQYPPQEMGQGVQPYVNQLSTDGARYEMGPGGTIRETRQ